MTSRSQLFFFLNSLMSSITCSARSALFLPVLTWVAVSFLTYACSNTAVIGLMVERKSLSWSRCSFDSTPALDAAW